MSALRAAPRSVGAQMSAPTTLVQTIKSVRSSCSCCWSLTLTHIIIICASFCCKTAWVSAVSTAEVKYPCAFIDTINVTGIAWAYEQPPNVTSTFEELNKISENNKTNIEISTSIDNNSKNTAASISTISTSDSSLSTPTTPSSTPLLLNSNAALLQRLGISHIPQEWIVAYDFIIRDGVRIPVERHLRACICKLKPCIRFCCAEGYYYDTMSRSCIAIASVIDTDLANTTAAAGGEQYHSALYALTGMDHHEVAVRASNGSTRLVRTADHFNVNIGVPCTRMRYVYRDNQLVHWTLFENGTIGYRHQFFSNYYCYTPHQLDNITWEWQPLACAQSGKKFQFVLDTKAWTYAICLILAVICMCIILFVYLFCTDLRNTFYGVAIKVYTLCIIIGYSLMAHLTLTNPAQFSQWSCINIPSCVILYMVLSFYILSLISFNFYLNFHGIIMSRLMFWLIFFPIALLTAGWSIFAANNDYDGKPIFGGYTCWFDPRNWSIMVYYYAPIFIACVLCIFFYILTLIHISEKRDLRKTAESLEVNRFKSFWKFFTYTFVVFLVCVTSFAINYYREESTHINYAVCLFIIFHGFSALYALIGQNHQVQNFLRRIEDDVSSDDDEMTESALPMSGF